MTFIDFFRCCGVQDTTILKILQCLYGLLLNPEFTDPLDSTLAMSFFSGSGLYELSVQQHTRDFAK